MGSVLNLPNQITIARLILSVIFFVLLGLFDQQYWRYVDKPLPGPAIAFLDVSVVVFVLAAVSDIVDGYLARKWKMISTFGRIADPFVDKVFICGSFVFLIPISPLVQPWFVVVIIMREFLVSGLRSFLEARGVEFGAGLGGKLKMAFQSVTIPSVMVYRAHLWQSPTAKGIVLVLLAATLFFTVWSTIGYVRRGVAIIRAQRAS